MECSSDRDNEEEDPSCQLLNNKQIIVKSLHWEEKKEVDGLSVPP